MKRFALAVLLASPASAADLLIHGGPILTMVGERPQGVAAVVVDGGRIAFVGPLAQARRVAGPGTPQLDLKGRTLLPGLVDRSGAAGECVRCASGHCRQHRRSGGQTGG
jgi:adenine deaminase